MRPESCPASYLQQCRAEYKTRQGKDKRLWLQSSRAHAAGALLFTTVVLEETVPGLSGSAVCASNPNTCSTVVASISC